MGRRHGRAWGMLYGAVVCLCVQGSTALTIASQFCFCGCVHRRLGVLPIGCWLREGCLKVIVCCCSLWFVVVVLFVLCLFVYVIVCDCCDCV